MCGHSGLDQAQVFASQQLSHEAALPMHVLQYHLRYVFGKPEGSKWDFDFRNAVPVLNTQYRHDMNNIPCSRLGLAEWTHVSPCLLARLPACPFGESLTLYTNIRQLFVHVTIGRPTGMSPSFSLTVSSFRRRMRDAACAWRISRSEPHCTMGANSKNWPNWTLPKPLLLTLCKVSNLHSFLTSCTELTCQFLSLLTLSN